MRQTEAFRQRIDSALANDPVRRNFRKAMDGLMQKRAESLDDPDELQYLRDQAGSVRAYALANLPDLLEQLEQQMRANGIEVHWAENGQQANQIIYDIMQAVDARTAVKGKSMVSEESGLNEYLIERGIDILESDLGEFIIQLAGEPPSHIIAPAIHKNRQQVAELFHQHFPDEEFDDNDIEDMTVLARRILRDKFANADVGISGVNFAVAETGTICLVENEGNGRLSTTAPEVHIAITGIEKVVARLEDIPPLIEILTRTATGQPISTYFNLISGPRKASEKDGPKQVHLVLLDNGRSQIHKDPGFIDTLRCIRCGTCINHCPVYVQMGGHAYGTVYPGPIGSVLEPQRLGLDQMGALTSACSLCGACGEVCPVKIPLPQLINQLRAESVNVGQSDSEIQGQGSLRKNQELVAWKLWRAIYAHPSMYRIFKFFATRLRALTPKNTGPWTRYRSAPIPAARSLAELARNEGFERV
jgi:L-lactate dehydrogenase complex protein LldF